MRWTHVTLPFGDLEGSIRFFVDVCGLRVVRDRRLEGGTTVWLGPPRGDDPPSFVLVALQGEVKEPFDHFGFQCATRDEVDAIAGRARADGTLVEGPADLGGSIGYFVVVREPSGHLVEFTHGQPLGGL
jgi:catechol 2,3-dioxygenase-like lactoylglutathione lyase family enzyme